MRIHSRHALITAAAIVFTVGCKKTADNTENYKSVINAYLADTPSCLWTSEQKFPTQIANSDETKNAPFAALVDAGLLTRTTSEKKIILVSKQETNYDLSDKGRQAWTSDPVNPGYGNFCYGHRTVQSINSATPAHDQPGATTVVGYTYTFTGAPDWAQSVEMQNAFPPLKTDLAGGTGSATLLDTSTGWKVQGPPPTTPSNNMTATPGRRDQ